MKAIDTRYNGYRFRSRLEARWALFYDSLKIPYQDEPEGFDLGGLWYLPDFYLPEQNYWIEVKARDPKKTSTDYQKVQRFSTELGQPVFFAIGQPWLSEESVLAGNPCFHLPIYPETKDSSDNLWPDCSYPHWWVKCPSCGEYYLALLGMLEGSLSVCNCWDSVDSWKPPYCLIVADSHPTLKKAFINARSARF